LLTIRAEAADDAAGFTTGVNDISSRPTTAASVPWDPPAWNVKGEAGSAQRTPDLSAVLQEIVDRPGWKGDQSVVLIVQGTGARVAESFDGDAAAAPLLHVEYRHESLSTIEVRVGSGLDDAEEARSGAVYLDSSDVELVYDSYESAGDQTVGLRFPTPGIPAGAVIHTAYVQFQADETDSVPTSLAIHGEASDDAAPFSASARDISSRPTTSASISWTPPAWAEVGQAGPAQRTPDLSAVIQEIVDRPGWSYDHALALIFRGTGARTAESWEGNAAAAPLLHVEYSTAEDWTFAYLPDTQHYTQYESLSSRFIDQTAWIVNNLEARNIAFVSQAGDLVQDGEKTTQWIRADQAMDLLDGDLAANPDGLVPYSAVIGNHDYDDTNDRFGGADHYLEYFGPSRYSGRSWYGGSSPNGLNHYQLFQAGDYTFLHLGLEWDVPGTLHDPAAALGWAKSILDQYPYTPAIITTHSYLWDEPGQEGRTPEADTPGGNSGEQVFLQLVRPNSQVFMVLNGHAHWDYSGGGANGEYWQISLNDAGLPVFEMLSNYQEYPHGGDGWLRTLEFQHGGGVGGADRIQVQTYSPSLDSYQTDSSSQFTFELDFNARFNLAGGTNVNPHALPDFVRTLLETSIATDVLKNDFDPNRDDDVTLYDFGDGSHGTVTSNGSELVYMPDAGFIGEDTFEYTIADGRGGFAVTTVTVHVAAPTRTVTFQNGQDGYAGTVDTIVDEAAPDAAQAGANELVVDNDRPPGSGYDVHTLLRFEHILGSASRQIPPGATVVSATLTLETTNEGDGAGLHRMLQAWSEMDTWTTLGEGVQADGIEAATEMDLVTGFQIAGTTRLDVTAGVQAWVSGQENFGWALLPTGPNGWFFSSAEGVSAPVLTVTFEDISLPEPLAAEGGEGPGAPSLTSEQLAGIVDAAVRRWSYGGLTPAEVATLNQTTVEIGDLPAGLLGSTTAAGIQVDWDAAGHGWYVDAAADDEAEFRHLLGSAELRATSGAAAGRMDLLSVVMHEMGHLLGLEDRAEDGPPFGLMESSLPPATRRLPPGSVPVWSPDGRVVLESAGGAGAFRVMVLGTAADDRFTFRTGGEGHRFGINGREYWASSAAVSNVCFRGRRGADVAELEGSAGNDVARLFPARGSLIGPGYRVSLASTENIHVQAGGGGSMDRAFLFDSPGDDRYVARAYRSDAFMTGNGYSNHVQDFDRNSAIARAGGADDRAVFYDSPGDDRFVVRAYRGEAFMVGVGYRNYARGFDRNLAFARSGGDHDRVIFQDSPGDDWFEAGPDRARLRAAGAFYHAKAFDRVDVITRWTGDRDRARFYNSERVSVDRSTFEQLAHYIFALGDDWRY
jgi:hypothetical protein